MDDGRCWCDRLEQESFRDRIHLNTGMWGQRSHIIDKKGIKRELQTVLEASRCSLLLCE